MVDLSAAALDFKSKVDKSLYSDSDFKELLEEEIKEKNDIIERHGGEVAAFEEQAEIRRQQFKFINDRETQAEKDQRFTEFNAKLRVKLTERQSNEI